MKDKRKNVVIDKKTGSKDTRGDEIRIYLLFFAEPYSAYDGDHDDV